MSSGAGPTAQRRQLGQRLRELRTTAGLTVETVAAELDVSLSTVSRMETGHTRPKTLTLTALLARYGVDEKTRGDLTELHRACGQPGWWHAYRGDVPTWFHRLLDYEETAETITTYEPQLIPGLLQTDSYATAVLAADPQTTPETVNRRAEVRLRRQQLLDRDPAPRLWAVIEEPVLLRPAGDPPVMRDQLDHLLAVAARPGITIQVVPLTAGVHPALGAGFTMLDFAAGQPPLVYVEDAEGANYLERPTSVRRFHNRLDHLRAVALSPVESRHLIKKTSEDQR